MKHTLIVSFYIAAIVVVGCRAFTAGLTATGNAALKMGYYGVATSALKAAASRNPHDFATLVALAKAETLAGETVDAFGTMPYTKLIIKENV